MSISDYNGSNKIYAEIIYLSKGEITCKELKKRDTQFMIDIMADLYGDRKDGDDKILCLDYHNVTDLYPADTIISTLPTYVISFVGRSSQTRSHAREEIKKRIQLHSHMMGLLVFERPKIKIFCKDIDPKRNNAYIGTKAWIIEHILSICNKSSKLLFIDDSSDHVELVNLCNFNNVVATLVSGKDLNEVINHIKKFDNPSLCP